jgi:hypothetical protein
MHAGAGSETKHGFGSFRVVFVIPGQTALPVEPAEGARATGELLGLFGRTESRTGACR